MTTLGQKIIKLIDEKTELGFVFRVDMRLRPWGEGAPLVIGLSALGNYFDRHGRTWERFAWLKARVINPIERSFFDNLESLRKNFVFRYYVDYSAFSALREMRTLISNQVAQRQDLDNIKLGVGGIRDIEFIAQSFALIYGGKYPKLMEETACLCALDVLCDLEILASDTVDALKDAYVFLRRLEHAIQARHDTQTQKLPKDEALNQIAKTLGFSHVGAFFERLDYHRHKVSYPFDELVAKREYPNKQYATIHHQKDLEQLNEILSLENQEKLNAFWQSKLLKTLSEEAKQRLHKAYPILIHALLTSKVNIALPRLIVLLEAIVKRSIYLVMLSENPKATMDLMPMLASSPWIASELASYPVLLDTFLQKQYRHLPNKEELGRILTQSLLSVADFDDEAFLMSIRLFKKTQVLAVAASDILAHHPIMKVSDSLTFISEVVLQACLSRAFFELSQKHGFPLDSDGKRLTQEDCGFAIIGYGKLGGIEMSYASDLDVVFLHRVDEQAYTDGKTPISGMKFATRLVQKLITFLTTQTRDGRAYELDMRLRPSGNAGVMVVSLAGFEHYQSDKAWVWEHQALVRARGICGDKKVLQAFDGIRQEILCLSRNPNHLKQEVLSMREKMKKELGTKNKESFHLKQDAGGLVDIEFMAQYCVLNYAHTFNEMAAWSDNIRIFETAQKLGVWDEQTCQALQESYLKIRKATHIQALLEQSSLVAAKDWEEIRQPVIAIWQSIFATDTSP